MKLLLENWRKYLTEEENPLKLAAANVHKVFQLVKQIEKAQASAPEKHTNLENLKKQNQIFDQVFEPYYNNLDKLTDRQMAIEPGPNWREEYRKIQKLIGVELRSSPELFRKMLNIAKEHNFQFTKEFYKPMLDVFKGELKQVRDKLASMQENTK
jgi:hypothetical protein